MKATMLDGSWVVWTLISAFRITDRIKYGGAAKHSHLSEVISGHYCYRTPPIFLIKSSVLSSATMFRISKMQNYFDKCKFYF